MTELEPAPGFTIKEPATQEVYIEGGGNKSLTFENVPLNAIVVHKTDSVTGEALGGATFQLRYPGGTSGTGGTMIGQKVTGSNGMAIWTGLKPGSYIVEEVDPADGYSISSPPRPSTWQTTGSRASSLSALKTCRTGTS